MKTAILVDEMNAIHQLHFIGIKGIRPWVEFYRTLHLLLEFDFGKQVEMEYHFYGSLPPKDLDITRHDRRARFFKALEKDGIIVHQGLCLLDGFGGLKEKGVDMRLGLDLFEFSLNDFDLLFVFSGDADLVPAVQRAKLRSKVVAIVSRKHPGRHLKESADGILYLEKVIRNIREEHLIPLKSKKERLKNELEQSA